MANRPVSRRDLPILICGAAVWARMATPAAAQSAEEDRIFFSKSFPGSVPAYFEAVVSATGAVTYREAADEPDPIQFELSVQERAEVFALAERLDFFRKPLASSRKVAFTGDKILRFESEGGQGSEAAFTFTENQDAKALVDWFERLSETERHLIELERTAQFDRLGVNKTLLQFQASFDAGRIIAAKQFLPILRKIADQAKYVHIARTRAASLVQRIEESAEE